MLRKLGFSLFAFKDELFMVFGMSENQIWFRFYQRFITPITSLMVARQKQLRSTIALKEVQVFQIKMYVITLNIISISMLVFIFYNIQISENIVFISSIEYSICKGLRLMTKENLEKLDVIYVHVIMTGNLTLFVNSM